MGRMKRPNRAVTAFGVAAVLTLDRALQYETERSLAARIVSGMV